MGEYVGISFLNRPKSILDKDITPKGGVYTFMDLVGLEVEVGDLAVINTRNGITLGVVMEEDQDKEKVFEKFPNGAGLQNVIAIVKVYPKDEQEEIFVNLDDMEIGLDDVKKIVGNFYSWIDVNKFI